jgi:hypothetical protein
MLRITTEKDDFTGLKKITTPLIDLTNFKIYDSILSMTLDRLSDGFGVSKGRNAFELFYAESEEGQGAMAIRIYSLLARSNEWPSWNDSWPLIIDGQRASLESTSKNQFENSTEFKVYNLPVDLFNKLCNAKEVKFSLRGQNEQIEGKLTDQHILIFKVFEQFCFGDESEGHKIIETLNMSLPKDDEVSETSDDGEKETWTCFSCSAKNIVPKDWTTFSCHKCGKDNTITRPIKLSPEDIEKHENKTVELIKEKKVSDAIKYYSANFGASDANSKIKVKELADKNGVASIIVGDTKKKAAISLIFNIPIFSYLCYLGSLPERKVPMPIWLWMILVLLFGILTLRAIIKLFKK